MSLLADGLLYFFLVKKVEKPIDNLSPLIVKIGVIQKQSKKNSILKTTEDRGT